MPDIYLVEFKGHRKRFYLNPYYIKIREGEYVVVQGERGEDLGRATKKVEREDVPDFMEKPLKIRRVATPEDLEKLKVNREKENEALKNCRRLVLERNMEMKVVDVEFQFDCNKITFFFTADKRIDFRELVKDLAAIYKTRIELRQIGVRDEAKRMGGYGCCGLRLCCSTYLRDFEPISIQLARDQNLALTPSKISGNCGRLLCCLSYEKQLYDESLAKFPRLGSRIKAGKREGSVEKVNFFNEYVIVKYEDGEEEKLTLRELKKLQKKKKITFQSQKKVQEQAPEE
ncbi:MAG: regulatory iron-sulfur-containing complex subunit RicT [Candidatus Zixiibacteriota bacterium]